MGPEQLLNKAIVVGPNTWEEVKIEAGDPLTLATYDLTECTAVAMLNESSDGTAKAYLQHYHSDQKDESIEVLGNAIERHDPIEEDQSRIVIMAPTKIVEGEIKIVVQDWNYIKKLEDICINGLRSKVETRKCAYKSSVVSEKFGAGSLVMKLGHVGGNSIYAEDVPVISGLA